MSLCLAGGPPLPMSERLRLGEEQRRPGQTSAGTRQQQTQSHKDFQAKNNKIDKFMHVSSAVVISSSYCFKNT